MNIGDIIGEGPKQVEILEFLPERRILVKFTNTGTIKDFQKSAIVGGRIKDPKAPSAYGVGYVGEGPYNSRSKHYKIWSDMLNRCYGDSNSHWHSGTGVVDEWKDLQAFCKWADETCPGEGYELDKDFTGGTIYGPEFCTWLPRKLNGIINIKYPKDSGLPIGVTRRGTNSFQSRCNDFSGKSKTIGTFKTPEAAHIAYKEFKQLVLKEAA